MLRSFESSASLLGWRVGSVPPQTALLAMSDSDDFDLSDDEMADEGTAATVPLRPLHASRAAPPRCCCAPPTGARTGGL